MKRLLQIIYDQIYFSAVEMSFFHLPTSRTGPEMTDEMCFIQLNVKDLREKK